VPQPGLLDSVHTVAESFKTASGHRLQHVAMPTQLTTAVVQIFASDVPRSIAFYRLLGLAVPDPGAPDPHVEVALPGGGRLSFDAEETITGMHPDWAPPDAAGRVALAFGLESMFEQLTKAGHPGSLQPYDAPWGQRYATVLDPDGNFVDLSAQLGP
jgi:catechol 2,3-dioxygenase-like lactoylglutathione lyase family enzyme